MSWYDPSSWSSDDLKRAGLDVATGGQYENYRAATGESSIYDKVPGFDKLRDFATPGEADLTGVKEAQDKAFGLTDSLGTERANYLGQYDAPMARRNMNDLEMAAAGLVASPAEMQLQRQAAQGAANQFGIASALQGRNPGAALRSARIGSQQTLADANLQAAIMRAQEQQTARNQLTAAITGTRAQDIDERGNLLTGQVGALNAGTNAASAAANASATAAGAKNQLIGGLLNVGGKLIAA